MRSFAGPRLGVCHAFEMVRPLAVARSPVTPDPGRPLAIGKEGQNVRLASRLTDYEIDILDIGDLSAEAAKALEKKKVDAIDQLEGVTPELTAKLATANLTQPEQLKGLSMKDFMGIEGVTEEEAGLLVDAMKKVA